MKKKTIKTMIQKNKPKRNKIYVSASFSNGRNLMIPVFADDKDSIASLRQQLREKNGVFNDTEGNVFDLRDLVHYEFIDNN